MAKSSSRHEATRYHQGFAGAEGQAVNLRLQLTKQREFLSLDSGEVSDMAGIDVVRPWRRADPTIPLDTLIDGSLQPITQAFSSEFEGNGTQVFVGTTRALAVEADSSFLLVDESGDIPAHIKIGADAYAQMFGGGGWPAYLSKGNVIAHAYRFDAVAKTNLTPIPKPIEFKVIGVKTNDNPNDTIEIDQDLIAKSAFVITASRGRNLRGIIVTDGREFRLLQGGAYNPTPLLVVDEAKKGDIWRMARISNSRILLVSDKNVPRIITLEGPQPEQLLVATGGLDYDASAGLLKDNTGTYTESLGVDAGAAGWLLAHVSDLTSKDFSSRVEAVTDQAHASLVTINTESAGVSDSGVATASAKFEAGGRGMARFAGPPPIMTTLAPQEGPSEAIYISIDDPASGNLPIPTKGDVSVLIRLLDLETNAASPFFQAGAGNSDSNGGRERVFSMGNARRINLHFVWNKLLMPHRSTLVQVYRKLSDGSDYFLEKEFPMVLIGDASFDSSGSTASIFRLDLQMDDDTLALQPILETKERIRGVPPAGRDVAVLSDAGITLIAGKTDLDRFENPVWGTSRQFTYKWPRIQNDNTVHFSRVDENDPENFPPGIRNQIVLSRVGDKFQRFVQAGDDVLAVMANGVYRLSTGGILGVQRSVVGETGIGTPWPDSVISVRRKALWVGSSNVYMYDRSAEGTDREPLSTVGDDLYPWLRSAAKDGDDIRCIYDTRRQVIVIRRIKANGLFQDVELSFTSSSSSFMEDRAAVAFVESPFAGVTEEDHPILYAVGEQGDVREIGRESNVGDTHPYDGKESQVVLDGTHTIDDSTVSKVAAFTTAMIGDTIRFKSTNAAVDGQIRQVKTVEHAAFEETVNLNGNFPSIAMRDSRNGFLGYIDLDDNSIVIRIISIADDGAVSIKGGARITTGTVKLSLSLMIWKNGVAFTSIDGNDDPVSGALSLTDDALYSVTPSQLTPLDVGGAVRQLVDSVNIDGDNMIHSWKTAASGNSIDVVAVAIGDKGAIKSPESGNITEVTSNSGTSTPKVIRLNDTIAIVSYNSGTDFYISVITFDGEKITEIDTHVVKTSVAAENTIVGMSDSEFVVVYASSGGTTFGRHGTIDIDPASGDYGSIVWGAESAILSQVMTKYGSTRMLDSLFLTIADFSPNGPLVMAVNVNTDKSLTVGSSVAAGNGLASSKNDIVSLGESSWIMCTSEATSSDVIVETGTVFGPSPTPQTINTVHGPPDKLSFDPVPGLAQGDTIIIGSVPFRIRFAPVVGDKIRSAKKLDGISGWFKPDGRTVTTTKKISMKIRANLDDADQPLNRAGLTEALIEVRAPNEAAAIDESQFAPIEVEGKMLELVISNDDADTGLSIVHLGGTVRQSGSPIEDRKT